MTNFERIKEMSKEEVLCLITESNCYHCSKYEMRDYKYCGFDCSEGTKEWLESEVDNEQVYWGY